MNAKTEGSFGPYTPVMQAGNHYYISGQVGVGPDKQAAADIEGQTHQALQNLKALLRGHSLEMDSVVKTTVYLTDMSDFEKVNKIYVSYFPEPRPARACVEVAGLPKIAANKLLIELEAVAYKGPDS